ncbi:MAG: hypothetical protein D6798_16670 [Deltaproteobacteria bacterium]|nr:MAG: hypothetical protein D6798_16670 [Deltaproteobacteria bacterium]
MAVDLADVLGIRAPVESPYPWQRGEDAASWLAAVQEAGRALGAGPLAQDLAALAALELADGLVETVGRERMLGELLRTLHEPGWICQGFKGTCAVTCAEVHLAERQPKRYLSLVAGLLSPAGEAILPGGEVLRRDEERMTWDRAEGDRGPVSRLFQAAAMEAAEPDEDYDNQQDAMTTPDGRPIPGAGIDLHAFDRLLEALTGRQWAVLTDRHAALVAALGLDPSTVGDLGRDAPAIIARSVAAGEVCFATLDAPAGVAPDDPVLVDLLQQPHMVRVHGCDGTWVYYDDPVDPAHPWLVQGGGEPLDRYGRCRMPAGDFFGALVELSYLPDFLQLPVAGSVSTPG